jgi:hypothetical protein
VVTLEGHRRKDIDASIILRKKSSKARALPALLSRLSLSCTFAHFFLSSSLDYALDALARFGAEESTYYYYLWACARFRLLHYRVSRHFSVKRKRVAFMTVIGLIVCHSNDII